MQVPGPLSSKRGAHTPCSAEAMQNIIATPDFSKRVSSANAHDDASHGNLNLRSASDGSMCDKDVFIKWRSLDTALSYVNPVSWRNDVNRRYRFEACCVKHVSLNAA